MIVLTHQRYEKTLNDTQCLISLCYLRVIRNMQKMQRKDAVENHQTIIKTANKLFTKYGHEVSMATIAKEAKVGRATLYRNFPDKSALVVAIFYKNIKILKRFSEKNEHDNNAFYKLIAIVFKQRLEFNSFLSYIPVEEEDKMINQVCELFRIPVINAQKNGKLRTDFDVDHDLILLIAMLGGALLYNTKETTYNRSMQFILEGIK